MKCIFGSIIVDQVQKMKDMFWYNQVKFLQASRYKLLDQHSQKQLLGIVSLIEFWAPGLFLVNVASKLFVFRNSFSERCKIKLFIR